MRRVSVGHRQRRFGYAHPHELNLLVGYRGGVRK